MAINWIEKIKKAEEEEEKLKSQKAITNVVKAPTMRSVTLPTASEGKSILELSAQRRKMQKDIEERRKKFEAQKQERAKKEQEAYNNVKKLESDYKTTYKWLLAQSNKNTEEYSARVKEMNEKSDAYKEALKKYNEDYSQEVKARLSKSNKESFENVVETGEKALATGVDAIVNPVQGFLNIPEGLADMATHAIAQAYDNVGNAEEAERLRKNAQVNVTQDKWFGKTHNYLDEKSYIPEVGDEILQGVGYSATLAGLNLIPGTGKAISDATLVASSMGSSLNEAYSNPDVNDVKAWTKAGLSAGLELGVEKLFGVLGYGGSSVDDILLKSTDNIKNGLAKAIADTGITMTGEGVEEMLSYAGNYLIDHGLDLIDDSSKLGQEWDNQEFWKNFFVGAMSAGIAQGPANIIKSSKKSNVQETLPSVQNNNGVEVLPTAKTEVKQEEKTELPTVNSQPILKQSQVAEYVNERNVASEVKNRMQSIVNKTNKIANSDVQLQFASLDGDKKAQTDGNTITVDISKASLEDVIHEITHNTETSKGYTVISDYILTELDKRGELQGIKEEIISIYSPIYEQEGRTFTEQDLESEIVAKYTEQFASDENFVNKITQEDRNFAQKIYDWIKEKVNYYRTVKNMTDEQRTQYDELRKAEKLWLKALQSDNTSSKNDTRYSFIGQKGMKNYSQSRYGDNSIQSLFNTAREMKALGVDNEKIRQSTNWFQDKNGDWKFEFSDKDMSLRSDIKLQENGTYKLGEILQHDTLFMAYPELADYDVSFEKMNAKKGGGFNKNTKHIRINSNKFNQKNWELDIEGTLVHEIQHAIQNIEKFEGGTSSTISRKAYYTSLGEIEATDAKRRFLAERNGNKDIKAIPPESSKANPKHKNYDNYMKNRNIIDKVKDSVYNFFNERGENNDVSEEYNIQNKEQNNQLVDGGKRGRYVDNTLATAKNNKAPRYSIDEEQGKERKHYKSIATSGMVGEQGKKIARNLLEKDRYIPVSNQKQLEYADNKISTEGLEGAYQIFMGIYKGDKRITPNDIALGERLIQEYSKLENIEKTEEIISTVSIMASESGQVVQAFSIIGKFTPVGKLKHMERVLKRINAKNKTDIKLSEEAKKMLISAKTETETHQAEEFIAKEIAEQVPPTFLQELDNWRYLAMLGNPTTHNRNVISNIGMKFVMSAKNKVAGTIEDVFKPTERTRTLRRASKETKAFAKEDAKQMASQIANGGKYDVQSLIRQYQKSSKNKVVNALSNFNSKMLEFEDNIFIKSAYKNALANYMTANKLTAKYLQSGTKEANVALSKAREFASYEAQVATFRQFSTLASYISQIENNSKVGKVVIGGLLPFKKTPINIAKAGAEYSPLGIAKSLTYDLIQLKKGNINTSKFIDNISKGLTGTSISLIGYFLSQSGILSAGESGNEKEEDYKSSVGEQDYAIKIGYKTYTIDWLSPAAMPLFIGAEYYQLRETGELTDETRLNAVLTSLGKTFNPLVEMSMLQGLASALRSYSQDGALSALGDVGSNIVESYVGQFLPTALGKLARTIDDTERDTYYTDKTGYESRLQRFFNKQVNKIPFASKTLEPRLNLWGEEVKRDDNIAVRAFNQFLNPSYVKTIQTSTADKEVQRLYKASEDSSVLPKSFNSSFKINSENKVLTPKENTLYKKKYGQLIKNVVTQVANSNEYGKLPTAEQVKTIQSIYSDSKEKVKGIYASENKVNHDATDDIDTLISKKNLSLSNAYIYRGNSSSIKSDKDSKGETIDGSMAGNKAKYIMGINTSDEQKNLLLSLTTDSKVKPTVEDLNTIGEKNYSTYYSISNAQSREKYVDLASTGMNSSALNKYIENIGGIEGKKDSNGKTINGTLKTAKANYINSLSISRNEKLLLFGKDYKLSASEKQEVLKYVNSLSVSSKQKLEILSQLKGVTIKNNKVYWD